MPKSTEDQKNNIPESPISELEKSSQSNPEDDDIQTAGQTAGGRKGNFSDKDRDNENQWSPGSTQSSDQ